MRLPFNTLAARVSGGWPASARGLGPEARVVLASPSVVIQSIGHDE